MASLIQVRRDTQANWIANNPILASGEIAFSTDQYKIKIGNGVSNWSNLSYMTATPTEITNQINAAISNVIDSAPGTLDTLNELAAALNDDPTFFTTVATNLSNHESDTTNIHGISNTANLVYTNDSRLSDSRTPNAHASTHGAAGSDPITIAQSQVTNLTTDLSSKASTTDLTNHTSDSTDVHGITNTANLVYTDDSRLSDSRTPTAHTHPTSDITNFTEDVQDVVGGMVSSNTESGISVTYDDTNGKLDFNVNDPTISLTGDITGSATMTDLGNVSITTTNSDKGSSQNIFKNIVVGATTVVADNNDDTLTVVGSNGVGVLANATTDTIEIYNTGVTSISGTTNQITASGSTGSVTLSLPSAVTFPGTVTLNSDPTQSLHAVTKQYVDAVAEGLHVHQSCATATTENITNLSSPPASIDGVTLTTNMRVLVKNQSTTSQNGIYVFNGTSLVRASDFDSPAEIDGGDFVFVSGGTINDSTGWVQVEIVGTIGTDPITFTQFSGAGTYTAGTGLSLNGNQFSNTGVLSLNGTANQISVSGSTGNITISLPETINASISGNAATVTNGVVSTGSYSDPSWITSIAWSKIASTPTTLSGYGITDAQPVDADLTAIAALAGTSGILKKTAADTWTLDTNTYLTTSSASSTYAPLASPTFTGTVSFSGATVTGIDLLPSQSGNSGKYLTTNGTNASWGTINVEPTIHPMFIIGGV